MPNMKTMLYMSRCAAALGGLVLLGLPLLLITSCKENISDDAYAIATKQTMSDYIADTEDLSLVKDLFDQVRLGNTTNASTLTSVLSARGNYTVFAPNNEAMQAYMDSLGYTSVSDMTEEEKEQLALNCIIDNGDTNAYETADFPTGGDTFATSNLKDRKLSSTQNSDLDYVINGTSTVVESNIEVSNGMLHIVDCVINPSTDSVGELLQSAENMRIFGELLNITGWVDSLQTRTEEEEEYETENADYAGTTKYFASDYFPYREKRYIAYTLFAETDEVFANDWGVPTPVYDEATETITNWDAIISVIQNKCSSLLPTTDDRGCSADITDYTDPANVVNRFVAYHCLYGGMSTDEFVHHWNEYGFDYVDKTDPATTGYTVDVWDFYTTMGQNRGLLKITQVPDGDNDFYINRITEYNDGISGDYLEVSTEPNNPGQNGINVRINAVNDVSGTTYDNNALNGFYYPIDNILIYNNETRKLLASQRIRIDFVCFLPEVFSQDIRGIGCDYFPNDYFDEITNCSSGTEIYYLQDGYAGVGGSWKDYQGDEFLVTGRYDMTVKLPPVPYEDTYEIRMGCSLNTLRGMVQIYFGDSEDGTTPIGLPIDERESTDMIPGTPWVDDSGLDEATIRENDRNLRNQNYMKAPNYFCVDDTQGLTTVRNATPSTPALRRILTTQTMSPGKTYYMRLKTAIETDNVQFMIDYFEFVPTSIVNAVEPEDIW